MAPQIVRIAGAVIVIASALYGVAITLGVLSQPPGDNSDVPEVPGPPAELSVPHVKGAADLSEDASATPTATPSADATETPTPATGTTGSTGTTGTGGTTAATPTPAAQQPDSASNDTSTSGGTPPQQFEQFCQENAGAC